MLHPRPASSNDGGGQVFVLLPDKQGAELHARRVGQRVVHFEGAWLQNGQTTVKRENDVCFHMCVQSTYRIRGRLPSLRAVMGCVHDDVGNRYGHGASPVRQPSFGGTRGSATRTPRRWCCRPSAPVQHGDCIFNDAACQMRQVSFFFCNENTDYQARGDQG